MNEYFFEIDYEIEAGFDEYGDFPLYCATLLFDLLNINGNIIIKNQNAVKAEKANTIWKYNKNGRNCYYEWPKSPDGNYCIWIKEHFSSNQEIIDILKLQGTYLSYIVPNDSFDWEDFLIEWKMGEQQLLLSGQVSFICNVFDMDRTLNLNFSVTEFSREKIRNIILKWEKAMAYIAQPAQMKRTETRMRSKYGDKTLIRLCFE